MTGLAYEKIAAAYLRRHGYHNVHVTQGTGDYGVDIVARRGGHTFAVQCKYYSAPVGLSAVQQAVAGMAYYHCDRAMVITNSTYTKQAKALADANGVILLEGISAPGGFRFVRILIGVLTAIYLFFALAAVSAAVDVIRTQPFVQGLINGIALVLLVTAPLWLWLLLRWIRKKIRNRSAAVHPAAVVTHAQAAELSVNASSAVQKTYADTESVYRLLCAYDDMISRESAAVLVSSERVSVPRIQRAMKYGFARACRVFDYMVEHGYLCLSEDDPHAAGWTARAIKPFSDEDHAAISQNISE